MELFLQRMGQAAPLPDAAGGAGGADPVPAGPVRHPADHGAGTAGPELRHRPSVFRRGVGQHPDVPVPVAGDDRRVDDRPGNRPGHPEKPAVRAGVPPAAAGGQTAGGALPGAGAWGVQLCRHPGRRPAVCPARLERAGGAGGLRADPGGFGHHRAGLPAAGAGLRPAARRLPARGHSDLLPRVQHPVFQKRGAAVGLPVLGCADPGGV